MPRLKDSEYQTRRAALGANWDVGGELVRRLPADAQWALHDFYLFTRSLDTTDLNAARAQAIAADPELATRAGLAYCSFARLLATQRQHAADTRAKPATAGRRVPRRTSHGPLVVTPDEVAESDPHAMARLLLAIAREQAERTTD